MPSINDKFTSSLRELGIFEDISSSDALICGLSGGADSCAMVYLLRSAFPQCKIHALHVNHMIRGEEAERDRLHCQNMCASLGITFVLRKIDIPEIAKRDSLGIEETARRERYRAFDEYRKELTDGGERKVFVCTAHNADDNLETVIFNLIRGCGTHGVSGIAPKRDCILRPMLSLSSAEIRSFMDKSGLEYVVDSTNSDVMYTRNKLRSRVIPILREISPSCEKAAYSASLLVRRDDEFLLAEALRSLGEFANKAHAPVEAVASLSPAVMSRALMILYSNARGEKTDLRSVQVRDCMKLICTEKRGQITLPGGISMYIENGTVSFSETERKDFVPFMKELSFSGSGCKYFSFPEQGFAVALSDPTLPCPEPPMNGESENIYKISIHTSLSFAKIKGTLYLRNRLPGDKIFAGGMNKKVKKLFNALHTPDRDSVPIFCDGDGIVYIPGVCVRDGICGECASVRISYWK